VAVKIEINPLVTGAALRAAQQVTIKGPSFGQGCDGKCQVKGLHAVLSEDSKKYDFASNQRLFIKPNWINFHRLKSSKYD
jgi:hypothetical protein